MNAFLARCTMWLAGCSTDRLGSIFFPRGRIGRKGTHKQASQGGRRRVTSIPPPTSSLAPSYVFLGRRREGFTKSYRANFRDGLFLCQEQQKCFRSQMFHCMGDKSVGKNLIFFLLLSLRRHLQSSFQPTLLLQMLQWLLEEEGKGLRRKRRKRKRRKDNNQGIKID